MKSLIIIFSLLLASTVSAQKVVNDANAEARTVGSFHAVHVSSAIDLVITQGSEEAVAVSAVNKEEVANIKTVVEDGVLKIYYEKSKIWPRNRKLKAYVSVKTIDGLKASGASEIKIEGSLKATDLKLSLSGASELNGTIDVSGKLTVSLSGASDMTLKGSASEARVDVSGASDMKAYGFTSTMCSVDASGASRVNITVDRELSASLSGASSLSYKGSATIRDIRTSGSSSISKRS